MFNIERLTLENFKCFKGKHVIEFPDEPGLYFLTGSNNKDKRLESNGAGKSTLLDAIYWCLYGRTLRGLRAGDIITWGATSASVELILNIAGEIHTLKRTQSPNSLYHNDDLIDEPHVQGFLNLSPNSFQRSVIMAQFNEPFLSLTPTAKLDVFSQILNLDKWLDYSRKAANACRDIELAINQRGKEVGALELALEAAESDLRSLERRADDFANEQKKKVDGFVTEFNRLVRVGLEIYAEENLFTKAAAAIQSRTDDYETKIKRLKADIADLCDELNHDQGHYHKAGAEMRQAKVALEGFTVVGSYCPTCMQNVSATHLKKEIKAAEAKLKAATKIYHEAEEVSNKQQKELTKLRAALADAEENLEVVKREEKDTRQQLDWFKYELKKNANDQQAAKRAAEDEAQRTNPYQGQINEKKDTLLIYRAKRKKGQEMLELLSVDQEATQFWIQGFKQIRLIVLEDTLRQLEIEVNSCITQLGLHDWSIEFDVERENKSGGLTKGFVVLIHAPGVEKPVRWEAWSGGETQRLQLAGDLGLANLIMNQAGLQNTIEFFDEPSQHLSKAGQLDLAETLQQRAIDEGKRVFYIDHNMPEFGDFAGVITVVKNESGDSNVLDNAS